MRDHFGLLMYSSNIVSHHLFLFNGSVPRACRNIWKRVKLPRPVESVTQGLELCETNLCLGTGKWLASGSMSCSGVTIAFWARATDLGLGRTLRKCAMKEECTVARETGARQT